MSFGAMLSALLIEPLQLLFEVIFTMAERLIGNPGLSIVVLSLAMNFLVLPLYKRADAMQEEEREMELRLHDGVAHIKKTFRGDERMMILQTYYRQNHYKPTYVLRGATSLLLEIPFFIAAYRFLSGLESLHGVSFGPIADLGQPDNLLHIAGLSLHLLPIIMTAVNLVSCVIFTKGSLLKTKIQLYTMAVFFLFFLYESPAGLVFYWTLNNVFSLVKTIFYKLKHADKVLAALASAAGAAILAYGLFFYPTRTARRLLFFAVLGLALQFPLVRQLWQTRAKKEPARKMKEEAAPNGKFFALGCAFLSLLLGVLIPSAVLWSSPQEFMDVNYFYNPLWYLVKSGLLAAGMFSLWLGIFYWLAKPRAKVWFERGVWLAGGLALVNYMCFGNNLGILSAALQYERGVGYTLLQQAVNLGVLLAAAGLLYTVVSRWRKFASRALALGVAAVLCMSVINIAGIVGPIRKTRAQAQAGVDEAPHFTLSKTGKNVIVLMLDRGMNAYIPYIFGEKPELREKFSGFVYYSNTLSYGGSTNFGSPSIFGGYEYTPAKMNARGEEPLVHKHNEALKMMPTLFRRADYDVTVFDPVYANYQWIPDLSIYDDDPSIHAYITKGKFTDVSVKKQLIAQNMRNFFCYSIFKTAPLCVQPSLYDHGRYNEQQGASQTAVYGEQTILSYNTAEGLSASFMEPYNVLCSLPSITKISEDAPSAFLMMANDTTHEPMLLQEPDYVPRAQVDNTDYEQQAGSGRFIVNGRRMRMVNANQLAHYQINMAAMLQLANWFDYMRENGVYDNTRIILVSDHGRALNQFDELKHENGLDAEAFYPLLMVKDFGADGFATSEEFMTTADVPTMAMQDLVDSPVNPFTGKAVNSDEKYAHAPLIIDSGQWDTSKNNGNTFLPGDWYRVHGSIWNKDNWELVAEDAVLTIEE